MTMNNAPMLIVHRWPRWQSESMTSHEAWRPFGIKEVRTGEEEDVYDEDVEHIDILLEDETWDQEMVEKRWAQCLEEIARRNPKAVMFVEGVNEQGTAHPSEKILLRRLSTESVEEEASPSHIEKEDVETILQEEHPEEPEVEQQEEEDTDQEKKSETTLVVEEDVEEEEDALSCSSADGERPTTVQDEVQDKVQDEVQDEVQEEDAMPTWLREANDTMEAHPPSEMITLAVAPSPPLEEPHAQDPLPRRGKNFATTTKPPASSSSSTTSTVTSVEEMAKEEEATSNDLTKNVKEVEASLTTAVAPPRHTSILCDGRVCLELMGLYPPTLLQHFATQRIELLTQGSSEPPKVFLYVSNRTIVLGEYSIDLTSYISETETYQATRRNPVGRLAGTSVATQRGAVVRLHQQRKRMQERR